MRISDWSSDVCSSDLAFADDPRVTLLTLPNGGKAAALNRALAQATGEIVIALDADTQFEPQTIARLARWFADPALGAVAGEARVGTRVNRPEERRGGNECVRTWRSRGQPCT